MMRCFQKRERIPMMRPSPERLPDSDQLVEFHFVRMLPNSARKNQISYQWAHFVRKQIPMFLHHLFPPQDQPYLPWASDRQMVHRRKFPSQDRPYPPWVSGLQMVLLRKTVEPPQSGFFKINRVGRFSRLLIDCRHLLSNHWIEGG